MTYPNNSAVQPPRPAQTQPFSFNQYQPQISQPIFPQPSGNIYFVNNSLEVANIPVGVGTSAVLCLSENLIYLKSMQNGMPMLLGYKISPLESSTSAPTQPEESSETEEPNKSEQNVNYNDIIAEMRTEYQDKIKKLEDALGELREKVGGLVECQF